MTEQEEQSMAIIVECILATREAKVPEEDAIYDRLWEDLIALSEKVLDTPK